MFVGEKSKDKKTEDSEFELPESQKYKLTLGIDRETVRRAKIQDINISYWTEQLLKIMTFNKEDISTSHEDIVNTWLAFLTEVRKLLEKCRVTDVEIGRWTWFYKKGNIHGGSILSLNSSGYIREHRYKKQTDELEFNEMLDIELERSGISHWNELPEAPMLSKQSINQYLERNVLRKPKEIINNLLWIMAQSSYVNKEKIKEINIALRIVKMMSENGEDTEKGVVNKT
jgi:hypothetical protein